MLLAVKTENLIFESSTFPNFNKQSKKTSIVKRIAVRKCKNPHRVVTRMIYTFGKFKNLTSVEVDVENLTEKGFFFN